MAAERKPEFFAGKGLKIGIIGCGYVGFPWRCVLRMWASRHRIRHRQGKNQQAERRAVLHPAHFRGENQTARGRQTPRRHHRFHPTARDGCGADLRAHAARRAPRTGPELRGEDRAIHRAQSPARPVDRAGEHHLSGHHRRIGPADTGKGGLRCPIAVARSTEKSPPISIWRFRRSAKIRATSSTAWRRFRKSSAGSIRRAATPPWLCTRRSYRKWFRSARRAPRKWSSCWKIYSAA